MKTRKARKASKDPVWIKILYYLVLTTIALVSMFPLYWGLLTSLKPEGQIMVYPPAFIPETLTLENYYKVLFMSNYRTYFMNNIIVAVISVIFASVVAGHAAFAFSRMKFRHSEKIMFAVLMTAMIPPIAQLIPLYILAVKTGLYNTKIVLVLIYAAWRTPILTWLLKGFFEKIPRDIEESAMIDGCTKAGVFYKIVLPISKPGIASVALLSAVFVWNDYLVSASFVSAEKHRMLSPGIYNYITGYGVQWGQLMGGVCMAVIPIIILFISLQKQFVAGLSAGAVKG
jgi:ABC-type glycerol-3-phosphate transport system permease component